MARCWGFGCEWGAVQSGAPPVPQAPTVTAQPSILPAGAAVGDSVTIGLGGASGSPPPVATWDLTLDGVSVKGRVDPNMAIELVDSGAYELTVTWMNASGSAAADPVEYVVDAPAPPLDLRTVLWGYIDANSPYAGSSSNVTGVTNVGTGGAALSLVSAGSGNNVGHGADGFTFADGKRLQATINPNSGDGAMLAVEFTQTALDTSAASLLLQLGTGRILSIQYAGTSSPGQIRYQYNVAGTTQNISTGIAIPVNDRRVLAVEVDRIAGTLRYWNGIDIVTVAVSPVDLAYVQVQIGSNFTGTVHRACIGLKPTGGAWGIGFEDLLSEMGAGNSFGPFTTVRVLPALIQSEGRPAADTPAMNAMLSVAEGRGIWMRGLKNTSGADLPIWGAGDQQINQAVPAADFGLAAAALNARSSTVYAAQYAWAAGQPATTGVVVGDNGFGGVAVGRYLTGASPGYLGDNQFYWLAEFERLAADEGWTVDAPWFLHFVGTSGKSQAYASWRSEAEPVWDEHTLEMTALFGTAPKPCVVQTGAEVNSSGGNHYQVTQAQYDMAASYGGIIAVSQRLFPITDVNIHPSAKSRVLIGETCAWAMTEAEAGRPWTPWATVTKSGATVTVAFALRSGETLTTRAGLYAAYGTDAATAPNLGFEADGGIAGVSYTGSTVTITLTNPGAAWLRFAMQRQNVSSYQDGEGVTMSAHRSTLFPSETKPSAMYPGDTLWRSLPSFSGTFAGDTFTFGLAGGNPWALWDDDAVWNDNENWSD